VKGAKEGQTAPIRISVAKRGTREANVGKKSSEGHRKPVEGGKSLKRRARGEPRRRRGLKGRQYAGQNNGPGFLNEHLQKRPKGVGFLAGGMRKTQSRGREKKKKTEAFSCGRGDQRGSQTGHPITQEVMLRGEERENIGGGM